MRFNPFFSNYRERACTHHEPLPWKGINDPAEGAGSTRSVFKQLLTAQMTSRTVQQVSRLRVEYTPGRSGLNCEFWNLMFSSRVVPQQKEGEEIHVLQLDARRDSLTSTFLVESLLPYVVCQRPCRSLPALSLRFSIPSQFACRTRRVHRLKRRPCRGLSGSAMKRRVS